MTPPAAGKGVRWIVRLRSGSATAADHAELAQWRAADPANERAYRRAQRIWDSASKLEQDPSSGLMRIKSRTSAPVRDRPRLRRSRQWGIAASLLVAGASSAYWIAAETNAFADYSAGVGEIRTVSLADHSTVSLDADTAIDVQFDGATRSIRLREGKAFFKVTRDASGRPFQVHAGDVSVTVRGTAFEVERFADGTLAVAVSEHSVLVRAPHGTETSVVEGQKLVLDASGARRHMTSVRINQVAAWRDGHLIADTQPLTEVVDALSRHFPGWIVVQKNCLDGRSINARLNLRDPMGSLKVIGKVANLRIQQITPFLVVVSPTPAAE